MNPGPVAFEIRPPWKDELLRVRDFIPQAFRRTEPLLLRIAVHGPLERIIAASALIPPLRDAAPATLEWRVAGARYRTNEMLVELFRETALDFARQSPGTGLRLARMLDEASLEASALREVGFQTEAIHDVFELSARGVWERLDRLHQRLSKRGVIPPQSKLVHLSAETMPEAAALLGRHLPEDQIALSEENEGFKLEHSYVLLVEGRVKGILLSRQQGAVSHVGVVLVAQELRGGYAWANIALYHATLREAIEYGVERLQFTADPLLHPNTLGFASSWEAERVGRKVRLRWPVPEH